MALPKLNDSKFIKIDLPSGKKATIRPFLGHEEKILLTAKVSGDDESMMNSVLKVVQNCTEEDIEKFSNPDVEWILLNLRAISVSPVVEPKFRCIHCENETQARIPISSVSMPVIEKSQLKIDVGKDENGNEINIVLNLPTFGSSVKNASDPDGEMKIIFDCLEGVYLGNEQESDFSYEEFSEWVLNLKGVYMESLKFIKDSPSIEYKKTYNCDSCGKENSLELKGLKDFFI